MIRSGSMLGVVAAMLGIGIYGTQVLPAVPTPGIPDEVIADIRRARVDLYCSNDSRAVAAIRSARQQLRGQGAPVHAGMLKALDEAAWQVRQHHFREAEDALEDALRHGRRLV